MAQIIYCDIKRPIRLGLTWEERWLGVDRGLVAYWENGRELRLEDPELASRANAGELPTLGLKKTTLSYLAMWQGLRGEDLSIDAERVYQLTCQVSGRTFKCSAATPGDDD